MAASDAAEYKFSIEWFDELAGLSRPFILAFFDNSASRGDAANEIAIFDKTKKRMFLKRGPYKDVSLGDLYEGAQVTVYARQFKVTGYADPKTKAVFETDRGLATVVVPPQCYREMGSIVSAAQRAGFSVTRMKTLGNPDGGVSLAFDVVGNTNGDDLHAAVFPGSVNPLFRQVEVRKAASMQESDALFTGFSTTATFDCCSLLLVKPHAVRQGLTGQVLTKLIDANFEVSAVQLFTLSRAEADNFAEIYKGVIQPSEYSSMTQELSSGPLVAVEVRAQDCVPELRQLCGPMDVEVAKALRPNTLRALFGSSKIENAVHCTDLAEDAVLECQFFFDILVNRRATANQQQHK